MKYFNLLLIMIALSILTACESELDIQPESSLTYNGFWDSEEAARAAHVGLYANFRSRNSTFWGMGEVRSDIWGGPTLESPSNLNLITQNISATQVPYNNWAGFYGYIHHINDFLNNIESIEFQDEEEKKHLIGQVYGLRAYIYYTLLKTWGGVPITTEPLVDVNPEELARSRASEEEVMQLIKDDIQNSLVSFGDDTSFWNGKKTYWSQAATLILKGDVYLWSGNLLGGGQEDFIQAKNALEEVERMGFELVDNYNNLWGEENEDNSEFIFQLDYTRDEAGNFYNGSFTGRATEINATWDAYGNSMSEFIANGGNRYGPSINVLEAIDDTDDTRRNATFIRLYGNSDVHIPFDTNGYQASILKKFLGTVDAGSRLSNNDVPIYRYADVLLLLAEVKNHLGQDPSEEINQIRMRAFGEDYNQDQHAFSDAGQSENTRIILDERLKEFIGEGKRWWDLRRAGNSYVIENIEFLSQGDEYKFLLPISSDMMASNSLLEQTPGY